MNTSDSTTDTIGHGYAVKIADMVQELRDWASRLDEGTLYAEPPTGEWTVMENLVHVVEFLPYWAQQLHRVIESPGEPFGRTHEDPERIAAVEDHARDLLEPVLVAMEEAADRACRDLSRIPDELWTTTGVHRRGVMSLHDITDFFLLTHLAEHTEQAKAAADAVGEEDRTSNSE